MNCCLNGEMMRSRLEHVVINILLDYPIYLCPEEIPVQGRQKKKMEQARRFYEKYGVYKREIVIDEHGVLMDGYTTYLLMCEQGKDMVLVRRIRRQGIKAVFNEGGKQYQWEIPLKLIDKIAPGDRVVVETFYGPQRVTVKEIIPLAKRTGRKVRRIEEKEN